MEHKFKDGDCIRIYGEVSRYGDGEPYWCDGVKAVEG